LSELSRGGTDSVVREQHAKDSACGWSGIFTAPFDLESYASVFDEEGALDKLDCFASVNGLNFYGLPLNEGTVTLERVNIILPDQIEAGAAKLVPFHAGEELGWRIAG